MESIHRTMATNGLVRTRNGKVVAGVCGGIARKLSIDPGLVRLVFVLLILLPGSQLIFYPIAWLLMPDEEKATRLTYTPAAQAYPQPTPQDTLHH